MIHLGFLRFVFGPLFILLSVNFRFLISRIRSKNTYQNKVYTHENQKIYLEINKKMFCEIRFSILMQKESAEKYLILVVVFYVCETYIKKINGQDENSTNVNMLLERGRQLFCSF